MKKRYIVLLVFVLLVVGLLTWRLWPRSLANLLPKDAYSFPNVFASAMVDVYEVGQVDFLHYRLDDQETTAAKELLDILNTSGYRPAFRNLLPWTEGALASGSDFDGRSVILHFYVIAGQTRRDFSVQFLGRSQVSISTEDSWGVYHATNPETLTALVEYIQTHGQQK